LWSKIPVRSQLYGPSNPQHLLCQAHIFTNVAIDLSAAVDVYGEWVDAADAVAKEDNAEPGYGGTSRGGSGRGNRTAVEEDYDDQYGDDDY
jgi:transcription elongation factor Elf1